MWYKLYMLAHLRNLKLQDTIGLSMIRCISSKYYAKRLYVPIPVVIVSRVSVVMKECLGRQNLLRRFKNECSDLAFKSYCFGETVPQFSDSMWPLFPELCDI